MAAKTKRARIKLLKHVIIEGKHTDAGKTIEMDRHKASELVASGQAKFDDEENEDGRDLEGEEQHGVRIEAPTHGDPGPAEVEPNRPRVTGARKHA